MVLHKFNSVSLTDIQANICTNASFRRQKECIFSLEVHKGRKDQHFSEFEGNYCNITGIKFCTGNSNSTSCPSGTTARGASPLRKC